MSDSGRSLACIFCGEWINIRVHPDGGHLYPIHSTRGGERCHNGYGLGIAHPIQRWDRVAGKGFVRPVPCPSCGDTVFAIDHRGGEKVLDELDYPGRLHVCGMTPAERPVLAASVRDPARWSLGQVFTTGPLRNGGTLLGVVWGGLSRECILVRDTCPGLCGVLVLDTGDRLYKLNGQHHLINRVQRVDPRSLRLPLDWTDHLAPANPNNTPLQGIRPSLGGDYS